uniref:ADP/ATP translocase n=1 Tax=Bubo bubo TaxID=30461 RepID=A0A8C0IJM8_BUBBB
MAAPQGKGLCDPISFRKDVLASNMAAAISKMVVVPVEQVKLLLQVQASSKQIRADGTHEGMVDCFVHIPWEQGFFSFWHGSLANVIQYFPTQALNFSFKDKYKQIFMSRRQFQGLSDSIIKTGFGVTASIFALFCRDYCQIQNKLSFILSFFTAQVVTTCSGMLSYPFDAVRRHMMMQSGETESLVLVLYDKIKAIFNLHVFREFRI